MDLEETETPGFFQDLPVNPKKEKKKKAKEEMNAVPYPAMKGTFWVKDEDPQEKDMEVIKRYQNIIKALLNNKLY
jgi:hypothetical protein